MIDIKRNGKQLIIQDIGEYYELIIWGYINEGLYFHIDKDEAREIIKYLTKKDHE